MVSEPRKPAYGYSRGESQSSRYSPYGSSRGTTYGSREAPPNATVKMSGLPYEATKSEIIKFFGSMLKMIPESIKILQKNGKSTGTGRITFESVEEATRAIEMKNGSYIGGRYINLSYWKQFR